VKVETFPRPDFTGTATTANRRNVADWRYGQGEPPDPTPRSIRYTASFKAENAGKYLLIASACRRRRLQDSSDGKQTSTRCMPKGKCPASYTIDLAAGQSVNIQADYLPRAVSAHLGFGIIYEPDLVSAEAKQFAKIADAVVLPSASIRHRRRRPRPHLRAPLGPGRAR
jgi:hypothetical protein